MISRKKLRRKTKKIAIALLNVLLLLNPIISTTMVMAEDGGGETMGEVVSVETQAPPTEEEVTTESNEEVTQETPEETASAELEMETGTAVAVAESVGVVNTTLVESEIEVATEVVKETEGDIVPFVMEKEATNSAEPESNEGGNEEGVNIEIDNQTEVVTIASASAITGENLQVQEGATGEAKMSTGTAVALANGVTVANTTLINSELEVGTISVVTPWEGDLILEQMKGENGSFFKLIGGIDISNTGEVYGETTAEAVTGENVQQASGSAVMETGDGVALASNKTMANTTLIGVDVFELLVENLFLWSGGIRNWEHAGSWTDPLTMLAGAGKGECEADGCINEVEIENEAKVTTVAQATAVSGGNTQVTSGDASMVTGPAYAGASTTNIVNTTLIDSRYRLLQLLLFSPWKGDLVFAYPDLVAGLQVPGEVKAGEILRFKAGVVNEGDKKMVDSKLRVLVSDGTKIVLDQERGVGDLDVNELREEEFELKVDSGWQKLMVRVEATGSEADENESNNWAEAEVSILEQVDGAGGSDEESEAEASLALTGGNNIGEYVYGGDGVRYQFKVCNEGPSGTNELMMIQRFFNQDGVWLGEMELPLGELESGKCRNVNFVFTVPPVAGEYYTETVVKGMAGGRTEIFSNTINDPLPVRARLASLIVSEAAAQEGSILGGSEDMVLGDQDSASVCANCNPWPWYGLSVVLSLSYYWLNSKKEDVRKRRYGLGMTAPLIAYGGLWMSSPGCRDGLLLLGRSGFCCKWFLVIALVIYGVIMVGGESIRRRK